MLTNIYKIMSKLLIYKLFVVFFAVTVNGQVSIYSYEDVAINQITSNVVEIDAEFFRISDLLFVNNKVLVIDKSNEPTVQIFKVVNDTTFRHLRHISSWYRFCFRCSQFLSVPVEILQ